MKILISLLILFAIKTSVYGQKNEAIEPKTDAQLKFIKPEIYSTTLYSVKDSTYNEIGKITNNIEIDNKIISQYTIFKSIVFKNDFIDITQYHLNTFQPILHTSSNDQRFITISYGDTIYAIYRSNLNTTLKKHIENMNNQSNYYDSSSYQNIIRWLPLIDGYTKEILVYNFDPNGTTGFIKVLILEVKSENFQTEKSGIRTVFKVTESYENSKTIHFIDKVDRRIWKQEMNNGKLVILRDE